MFNAFYKYQFNWLLKYVIGIVTLLVKTGSMKVKILIFLKYFMYGLCHKICK